MRRIYSSSFTGKIAFILFTLLSVTCLPVLGQNVPELIYYKFDVPGANTQNFASSPVGNNPAPVNGLTMGSTGQFGAALIGNGGTNTSNQVNSGWPLNLGTGPWTLSMWLNNFPATASTTQYFFGGGGGSAFRCFTGGVAGNNALMLRGTGLTDVPVTNIGSNPTVIHFVREITPASVIKVYRNGVLESSIAQGTPTLTGTDFWVGAYSGTTTAFPSGCIMDEFRLYNRALDAAEVGATWNISLPGGPCTEPPVPGNIVASANPVCLNTNFTLSTTGGSFGSGQTYQWQISSDNSTWNNLSGATNSSLTTSQSTSNYYRVAVTCGTTTVNSASIQVITPAAISGSFTINSNQPTGGSNFQSFNAAYDYIKCGINGAVTFNVDPASGPYTEQLIMTPIPGASATNTITFNGNGRVLQFLATNTNERAVIKLNGADHITFDSLTINALGTVTTEYGFGIQLINNADSNTVRKCTINITDNLTSTNYAGIVISASHTSATTTGNTESDGNLFQQNTVKGGYYSVTNVGSSTVANQRNRFVRNIIRDYYLYGFYVNGSFQTTIDGNDISRPSRTNLGTATSYAIYFTGLSTSARVNGNFIHGLLDVAPTSTNDVYGIYFTGVDALGGLENLVSNNAIYDIKSNGVIYGIYNAGSDNVFYYHNTISLDHAASTTTEVTRGFYQTTSAAGIEFKNNLITISRGGTGQMHALYFNTAASTIVSNYNNVYILTAANVFFGYNGTNQATLANWQTATTQDLNSISVNPLYVNLASGNLMPTSAAMNDLGTALPLVTTDILGAARSATNPDMGAWEFTVGPCTVPPTPGDANSSVTAPVCPNELVTLNLANNSIGTGQTYIWQSASSLAGPWTDISSALIAPNYNINPTVTLYYRVAVTCSGNTTYSTPVQVFVNALFPAGTYTINKTQPTTWPATGNNFNSFNAAYNALRCGIAGAVVFNVVSGTGPYTEQVIMGQIQGTSAVNTVTFNGNGETITFLSTNTNERAVFKLNGTDHFIFDSLTVVPQGSATTEYGIGFHLTNNADSNIIRNSTITLSNSTTSTNFAGIASSAGITPTTTGSNVSDFNIIDNNTITGGYYGITMVGSTSEAVGNNQITRNKIRDFYFYGIYLSGNFNTLVEANDLSRPVRTNGTTCYNVYMTSLNTGVKVSKNRIHNPFDGNPTSTSTFAGVYVTGVDALGGLENVVSNNAIYNVNGNGIQYGMYNAGSDNIFYYHNTVNLDDLTATTTSDCYGFYQTTAASGIDLKNNLISITRGGPGDKYCLFFNTATSVITSNYNNLYRNALNAYTGYNGSNQASLLNWQTATSQDANSLALNPFFTDPSSGDLAPRSPGLDNRGTPIALITTDINNQVRSATTPDIGAWEFTVPNCVAPPVAGAAIAIPNTGICLGTPIELGLAGNSFGAGQIYQWQIATNIAGPYTDLGTPMQFPDTTILASGTYYYQAVVTCSGQSVTSTPVLVNMNPAFPAGVYTINNTTPTTWPGAGVGSNFNSFVEAVAVMECGIAGAVTFNVAPGTYTEQVRMHRITGASNTSRVTFQSANGNPSSVILTYASTAAASNYTLQLDSASFITWRGITINATNASNGRAIDIARTASDDSIVNCIINVPAVTLTTTAVVGIHATALSGGNHTIKGNTVTGGTSGIYIASATTPAISRYNVIDSNFVNGSYQYGIYSSGNQFVSVSKNTVNTTAPRATTSYSVYLTNSDSAYRVNDNLVNINSVTTTNYGVYLTGCAAAAANPGSVSRNKVIALTGNTGTLYGIYQTGGDNNHSFNNIVNINTSATTSYGIYSTSGTGGIKYYNNSVQNASPATGTTNAAAYFAHTSSTQGAVNIRNNIFSHIANGFAMQVTNTANIYSDYNMLYTAGPTLVRFGTVNYANLQAWKNAQNWDFGSIVYAPAFAAGNELQPDLANANSWAMHGRGVQIPGNDADINGNPRPTTLTSGVPDMGAYEFLPTVNPPVLPATPASPAAGTTQVFMFGTDTVQKITWAPASTVPATVEVRRYSGVIPPGLAPGQQSMYFYTDVDITGSAPTNYSMQQFYIDPWMRDIPQEPTVKLGRTDAANAWFVSSNSVVDFLGNSITEPNLTYIDKFTGMTDGQAPAPPAPPVSLPDTSNRGRRFWVAYGHHYGFSSNSQDMVLYLSAEDAANVTV
ncbi:MAG TPA: LamG-like jellyroll fold domain-containing protein, partial [Chitinophagaceae bacterium]|nr:LamG-like jellyroll fold domain-containing protein [Chitinophagaceae bacterium]